MNSQFSLWRVAQVTSSGRRLAAGHAPLALPPSSTTDPDVFNPDRALKFHRYSRKRKTNRYSFPESILPLLGIVFSLFRSVQRHTSENIRSHCPAPPALALLLPHGSVS